MFVDPSELGQWSERLAGLHRDAARVLDGLDELGLYQAGAHLSLAMDVMRRAYRDSANGR
jgi:hypothetical protein